MLRMVAKIALDDRQVGVLGGAGIRTFLCNPLNGGGARGANVVKHRPHI
jgi:hypothetical protein